MRPQGQYYGEPAGKNTFRDPPAGLEADDERGDAVSCREISEDEQEINAPGILGSDQLFAAGATFAAKTRQSGVHREAKMGAPTPESSVKNPTAALNYTGHLNVVGVKNKAIDVLAITYRFNPENSELASEYGRLALYLGKVQLAGQLLNKALRAIGQPDRRSLSIMSTINAKRRDHRHAQSYYLAALNKQPGAISVYNL